MDTPAPIGGQWRERDCTESHDRRPSSSNATTNVALADYQQSPNNLGK